jgi:hypothetical protein
MRARVAITGRNAATLAQAAGETGMFGIRSDMASAADSKAALARIAAELGGIDVLSRRLCRLPRGHRRILGWRSRRQSARRVLCHAGGTASPS